MPGHKTGAPPNNDPVAASPVKPDDRPILGLAVYALAVALIVLMNAFAKMATTYHSPVEVLFYRNIIGLVIVGGWLGWRKDFGILKTSRIKGHFGRSLVGNIGVVLVFWAYSLMPMADATALLFSAPLIITALSGLVLGEKIGPFRWGAVVIGFIGVLFIADPSGTYYKPYGVFVALGAACAIATTAIFLRNLGRTEQALTTVFYFLTFGLFFTTPYMMFAGKWPLGSTILPLMATGLCAAAQLILKTQAYRWAEASLISPVQFTAILWATAIGWLVWGQLPTMWVIGGTVVVIAANLIVVMRERYRRAKPALNGIE